MTTPEADRRFRPADLIVLAALCLAPVLYRLGTAGLWDADEGRYGEIPREMVASGDWLTPRLNDTLYFEKPPLVYWCTAASYRLFGVNEGSARAVEATAGAAGVLLVWAATSAVAGPVAGVYAALALGTGVAWLVLSRVLLVDVLFSVLLAAAMLAALFGRLRPAAAKRWWSAAYAALALATLTKGPVAVVLWAGTIVAHAALERRWRPWAGLLFFLPGWIVLAALAAPWFVAMSLTHPTYAWFFFVHEHFLRYATKGAARYQPVWFFAAVLPAMTWPWTLWWPGAIRTTWTAWRDKAASDRRDAVRFAAVWIAVVVGFFSLSGSKLVTYVLPAFIPIALLTGAGLAEREEPPAGEGRWIRVLLTAGFFAALLAALAVVPARLPLAGPALVAATHAAVPWLLLAGAFALAGAAARRANTAVAATSVGSAILVMAAVNVAGAVNDLYSTRALAAQLAPRLKPADRVAFYDTYRQSLNFYLARRVALITTINELEIDFHGERDEAWFPGLPPHLKPVAPGGRVWVVVQRSRLDDFLAWTRAPRRWHAMGGAGDLLIYAEGAPPAAVR